MIIQSFGKRNKPTITYLYESDFNRYGKHVEKAFKRPSKYRSKNASNYVFVGGALVAYSWRNATKISSLFSLEELQRMEDPTNDIMLSEGVKTPTTDNKTHVKGNALFYFENRKPRIVSMPEIPENAWMIKVDPPTWIQVCRHGFLITRGAFWCNEKIGEASYPEDKFLVARHDDKWLVLIPPIWIFQRTLSGLYIAEKNRFIQEWYLDKARENVVFKNYDYEITFDGNRYRGNDYFESFPKEYFEMAEIEYRGKRMYIPYAYIKRNPDLRKIVSGVFP